MNPEKEFEERGVENYPFRSLYVDDNDPFSDKNSAKSISLIQNWDSISDKDRFKNDSFECNVFALKGRDVCKRAES